MASRLVGAAELARHRVEGDCWVAFHDGVYDVTAFLTEHPGGKQVLLDLAGYDGTVAYSAIHPKGMLEKLPAGAFVGALDPRDRGAAQAPAPASSAASAPFCACCWEGLRSLWLRRTSTSSGQGGAGATADATGNAVPTLDQVVNLNDFELLAVQLMQKKGYDYYASAACDELTKEGNCEAYRRVWLRPRVMVDVSVVNTSRTLLGCASALPIFVSPCAMAGLAHEVGELGIARAAGKHGVIQVIANMASRDLEEIVGACGPGQRQWYQVYINPDRQKSEHMLRKVVSLGVSVICVTVDTNVIGRRERDQRNKVEDRKHVAKVQRSEAATSGGMVGALGAFTDARLCWQDLEWLRSVVGSGTKIVLKGVQTGEDAVLAAQRGVDGIIVSNHGGRQLDQARPSMDALAEVTAALRAAGLCGSLEVFVDGGIRRGTDVYKALALGAAAVGIGRPTLYSLAFGEAGVDKCLGILRDEFINCMQLMGKRSLDEIAEGDVVYSPLGRK